MSLVRKKSLVEAVQYQGQDTEVETKLGLQPMRNGDYLITNPDGEQYPCPRETFHATYEAVDPALTPFSFGQALVQLKEGEEFYYTD